MRGHLGDALPGTDVADHLSGAYLGAFGEVVRGGEGARDRRDDNPELGRRLVAGSGAVAGHRVARGGQVGGRVDRDDLDPGTLQLPLGQAGEGTGGGQFDDRGDADLGQRGGAQVPTHRRGHLAYQPLQHGRAVVDGRTVPVGQQDLSGRTGGDTGREGRQGLLGRGHVRRVERACHGQRPHPGTGRRNSSELLQSGQRAGGDDLAGTVAVGRVQPGSLDRGQHVGGLAAQDGGHAGRFEGACGGHLAPARRGERDRGLRAEHAGQGRRAHLADAVAGDDGDVVHRQVLGGQQRGRDQQRLGLGGVLDLVGVGLRSEVYQVDPGQRGPPAQPRLGAGQVEPRGQETRLLGTLSGSEYGQHVYDCSRYRCSPWCRHVRISTPAFGGFLQMLHRVDRNALTCHFKLTCVKSHGTVPGRRRPTGPVCRS